MKKRVTTKTSFRGRGGMRSRRRSMTPKSTRSRTAAKSKTRSRTSTTGRRSAGRTSGRTSRSAKITTDHDEIRQWVESHGGHPATVKRTTRGRQAAGVLRIDFPGFSGGQSLKPISWDEWFQVFDERNLAFLYQGESGSGKQSRFNKLVSREGAKGRQRSR